MTTNEPHTTIKAFDAWKTTVDVQQHFNLIEMQIRNFAITTLTAVLGASALLHNEHQKAISEAITNSKPAPSNMMFILFGTMPISLPDIVLAGGILVWLAFYFMDRWWYHPLLIGAVRHAETIEKTLKDGGAFGAEFIQLSTEISKASPLRLFGVEIHSTRKIDLFYGIVTILLICGLIWIV
jgi:hypothetical protein